MKYLSVLVGLVLLATACSESDSDPPTTAAPTAIAVPTTSTAPVGATTTTTTVADATTTTAAVPVTTSTVAAPTATTTTVGGSTAGTPRLVISRVVFGESGYVSITNVGDGPGNLAGWQLCQRPAYYGIGPVAVAAGETVHFTTGSAPGLSGQVIESNGQFGRLNAGGGEIGLYVDGSFGSASSIRSYVEWGSSDHGRSSVAVAAGIWTEGGFVPSGDVPGLAARVDVPTSPDDWATS